jgi:hypothetical protein
LPGFGGETGRAIGSRESGAAVAAVKASIPFDDRLEAN